MSIQIKQDKIEANRLQENNPLSSPYIKNDGTIVTTHFVENEYLTINNEKYLKIFDHDVSKNPTNAILYFTDEDEAKYCFKPNKFSRLGDLNSSSSNNSLFKDKSDNKYQFLLRYPEISDDSTKGFNIWKQSFNPLGKYLGDDMSGYEDISINMRNEWGVSNTTGRGLGLNTDTSASLLDCQPSFGNWYGSIGQYNYWSDTNSGFPAPDRKGYYRVQLWVKVTNTPYDAYTAIQKTVNNEYILYSNNFEEKRRHKKWLN